MHNQEESYHAGRRRPAAPEAPSDFTAHLIHPRHRDYEYFRHRHHHLHHGAHMFIAFAWVNATTRSDGSALPAVDIAQSIISEVNADGSLTPVTTVIGNGTTATLDAPTTPGTYKYAVQNVDSVGNVGAAIDDLADVVIPEPKPAPPAAPTDFNATLEPSAAAP